jgi:hypothetical protein
MLRSSVRPLFATVEGLNERRVVLDFSKVEFMSRSFADEYLAAKRTSPKQLVERSAPDEVQRMLELVLGQLGSRSPAEATDFTASRRIRATTV